MEKIIVRIYQYNDYNGMSRQVANIISAQVIMKPDSVLGLATGATPIGAYRQLIDWYNKGDISFSQVRTFNLDEYVNLELNHEQSYRNFMKRHFFDFVNIQEENINIPDGRSKDILDECTRYEKKIADLGGIDIQLLGIGHNGHIGFNEPEFAFELGTHVVTLSESTRQANSINFNNDIAQVPEFAITMGVKNIMHARKIVIAASGEDKADIIFKAFKGPVMPNVPASILQMHPDVILVGDEGALYKLIESGEKLTQ